ncbi:MAG: hypothetical protein K2P78_03025 [Gemmataceae bacterium]|nr:hypothetical protein [Gemmataceae bacterium]
MFAATLLLGASFVPPVAPAPRERGDVIRAAVTRALPLLAAGAEGHAEQKTCFACHNQAFPVMAMRAAKARGFDVPDARFRSQAEHITTFLAENRERFQKGQGTGGQVDTAGYALLTLELAGHRPDENTEAVASYLLQFPGKSVHWRASSNRPPSEASQFTPTYLALRGLRVWGPAKQKEKIAERTEAARGWLLKTPAKDTEDRVFRLFALKEAAAESKEVAAAAWELLRTQRPDGGWGQLDAMASDPYATGSALVALHQAGELRTDHLAYRAGVAFLLRTQEANGSWWVKSRSVPFQPYYESGFPHGKNQFIAITASGWAATALVLSCQ